VVEESTLSHNSSLEPLLQQVEPRVRLVPERGLRQLLDFLRDCGRSLPLNLSLPIWVSRQDLKEADVWSLRHLKGDEPFLLLVTNPHDRMLSNRTQADLLLAYWRLLFQSAVTWEINRRTQAGLLTEEKCRKKLATFGPPAAREIRFVCYSEGLVVEDADSLTLYRAFAAKYLELNAFEKKRIEDYFPSLPSGDNVLRLLGEDVDFASLLTSSRPVGAAAPHEEIPPDVSWLTPDSPPSQADLSVKDTGGFHKLALEARLRGNLVRAAVLHTQLASTSEGAEQEHFRFEAVSDVEKVVFALGDLFEWDNDTRQEWRQAIVPLLEPAARGIWPRAARCLYELQRIPGELSRDVYAVDLPEYIRTFGRRPVKRLLPHARPVLILMHLKKAHAQMLQAGLDHPAQVRLDQLFHHQMNALEESIRKEFTPIITEALSRSGLNPQTTVETVGRDKLVAELLDRICERGYLRLGDLRDAIARNRLKMPDLNTLGDFLGGDGLLRSDLALTYALDGVYRKGEIYLRLLQRFSALFFGTKIGRLITVFIAIPFGGAFLALMFAEEIHLIGGDLISAMVGPPAKTSPASQPAPAINQSPPPTPDLIQADHVGWDEESDEPYYYPPEVVVSNDLELNEDGDPIWIGPIKGSAVVTQIFTSSATSEEGTEEKKEGTFLIAWPTILGFGLFLLFMIHVPPFRRAVFWVLGYLWWAIRSLLWDIPTSVWRSPTVRGIRQSHTVRFLVNHFWSPTLLTLLLFIPLVLIGFRPLFLIKWGLAVWVPLSLAYNFVWGWAIQDRIVEAIADWWRVVRANLLPGVFTTIIDLFRMLANWIERQLYAVDEWFRYRGGDSKGSLALKAFLGLLWFPLAYVFRFVFYLLVEPQINPIKHFPVVTVSHKVIWPMLPEIVRATGLSKWTVATFINGIPGIFGFMAWELKENWRLYKANLPQRLKPVMIGSHGETMRRLLRPGFHSGTVPKFYRKCRRADEAKSSRLHHEFEHLAVAVEQFATREFIHLLRQCPEWGNLDVQVEGISFGCQRLTMALAAPGLGRDHFSIAFENVDGHVEAAIEQTGWVDKLTVRQQALFIGALRGLLDMAAVETIQGRPRVEGTTYLGPGFDDLARTLTWTEWVECWKQNCTKE
jgi:hypothetical protein